MKYTIELDDEQLELIAKAIDFYSRIRLGNLSEFANPASLQLPETDYKILEEELIRLKKIMFPDLEKNEYYSIKSSYANSEIKKMIDIYEVIKSEFSGKNPYHWSNEKDLPRIKKVEE